MITKRAIPALVFCAVLLTGGCATRGEGPAASAPGPTQVTVRVENENWSDVVVYIRRNAYRARLGMVVSQTTESFRVSSAVAAGPGQVYLEADPIGSRSVFRSEQILAEPGSTIDWTITSTPALSRLSVR